MRRRSSLLAGVLLVLVGSSLAIQPAAAEAAASVDAAGWWWKLQTSPDVLLPGPPSVAEDQLLVQGAPDGAVAIAAIAATLATGDADPVLTLRVAEGGDAGGSGAVLLACQAGSQWQGGGAQAWADKPQPACDTAGVAGMRADDGSTWTFDLSSLQFDDQVNVVLVPGVVEGQPAGANGSVFSLTFEAPTPASIQGSPGSPPPSPTLPEVQGGDLPSTGEVPAFDPPAFGGGSVDLPPVEAALPEAEQGLTPVAPSIQDRSPLLPASVASDPRSEHAEAVGIVILLLGAALVYASARQQQPIGPDGIEGGLARWARPRWGSPPPLRG